MLYTLAQASGAMVGGLALAAVAPDGTSSLVAGGIGGAIAWALVRWLLNSHMPALDKRHESMLLEFRTQLAGTHKEFRDSVAAICGDSKADREARATEAKEMRELFKKEQAETRHQARELIGAESMKATEAQRQTIAILMQQRQGLALPTATPEPEPATS